MTLLQTKLKLKKKSIIDLLRNYDNAIRSKTAIKQYGINKQESISELREKREFFKGQLSIIEQVLNTKI